MPSASATAASSEPGRRERKKAETRRLIAETARGLFMQRGFEAVTVAEIARAADVAEKTVFNYFPAKEDLFYGQLETFEEEMLAAVRERPAGTGVVAAFREFLMKSRGALQLEDEREATEQLRRINGVIAESPALLAREREIFARYTESLAELIAEETRAGTGAIEPHVVASALIDVHRILIGFVRERTLAGDSAREVGRQLRARAKKAFALLEGGLGGYAVKR